MTCEKLRRTGRKWFFGLFNEYKEIGKCHWKVIGVYPIDRKQWFDSDNPGHSHWEYIMSIICYECSKCGSIKKEESGYPAEFHLKRLELCNTENK